LKQSISVKIGFLFLTGSYYPWPSFHKLSTEIRPTTINFHRLISAKKMSWNIYRKCYFKNGSGRWPWGFAGIQHPLHTTSTLWRLGLYPGVFI